MTPKGLLLVAAAGAVACVAASIGFYFSEKSANAARVDMDAAFLEAVKMPGHEALDRPGLLAVMSGAAMVEGPPADEEFGVGHPALVRLSRRVEMLQHVEDRETREERDPRIGATTQVTTATYRERWRDDLVDSSAFLAENRYLYRNPTRFETRNRSWEASEAKVDGVPVGIALAAQAGKSVSLEDLSAKPQRGVVDGDYLYTRERRWSSARVGDERLLYSGILFDGTFTVAGEIRNGRLVPFRTREGQEIFRIMRGDRVPSEMLDAERGKLRMSQWGLRLLFTLLVAGGLAATAWAVHSLAAARSRAAGSSP
jgi:hypothetical protein